MFVSAMSGNSVQAAMTVAEVTLAGVTVAKGELPYVAAVARAIA